MPYERLSMLGGLVLNSSTIVDNIVFEKFMKDRGFLPKDSSGVAAEEKSTTADDKVGVVQVEEKEEEDT